MQQLKNKIIQHANQIEEDERRQREELMKLHPEKTLLLSILATYEQLTKPHVDVKDLDEYLEDKKQFLENNKALEKENKRLKELLKNHNDILDPIKKFCSIIMNLPKDIEDVNHMNHDSMYLPQYVKILVNEVLKNKDSILLKKMYIVPFQNIKVPVTVRARLHKCMEKTIELMEEK